MTSKGLFNLGYEQAFIDIKEKAINPLRAMYQQKKRNSFSKRLRGYFDSKLWALKDIEGWVDSAISSKKEVKVYITEENKKCLDIGLLKK